MWVLGTAGHVDHGKTSLVHALTGMNPDRLREEQEREMTIDLGFAWLTLPSGREVSIVDVPGHEDFIKNMLAGIGGIDIALFVVAADESVMPQTREHLAILDLLRIPQGVVALTKIDLIEEEGWLNLVQEEVREELQGTVLEDAAIVPVSSVTGDGIPCLLDELDRLLEHAEPHHDLGRPRLPIDRVFTMSGFGTVVTGTLIEGRLAVGDEVQIVPGELGGRIRGLQSHKQKVAEAMPGARVAVNLSGVTVGELGRGEVLTRPGWLEPTTLLDARLKLLLGVPWPLKHNAMVVFFSGSARVPAHVRLLDVDILQPGQSAWVQFRLAHPIAVVRGDRYVVRLASPSLTLGGGAIVQAHPIRRHKRFRPEVVEALEALSSGRPKDVLLQMLRQMCIADSRELIRRGDLAEGDAIEALEALVREGQILLLSEGSPERGLGLDISVGVVSREAWAKLLAGLEEALESYHERYPLRLGMPREELRSRTRIDERFFDQVVERAERGGRIAATATTVRLPTHVVSLSQEQERLIDDVMEAFRANPFVPPSYAQVEQTLGAELLQFLLDDGRLIKASEAVLFRADTCAEMTRRLVAYLGEHKSVTVAQVRDFFGTSRKYALSFLEYMDRQQVTKRLGDIRVLR